MTPIHQVQMIQANLTNEVVDGFIHEHHKARFEWSPSDLLPCSENMSADEKNVIDQVKEKSQELPDSVRIALVLNMLTEEGLPMYHRLLYQAFGVQSSFQVWQNLWTAEEDRHGMVLRDYLRETKICNMKVVEQLQFDFISAGWMPEWASDPYCSIAYTVFQERATQVSHRNVGMLARKIEPVLARALACLAGDESRHYHFYARLMKVMLDVDVDNMLQAICRILKTFTMPGINIPGYSKLSMIQHAIDVFGPKNFAGVIQDVIVHVGLDKLKNLKASSEELKDKILAYPARLMKLHHRFIDATKEKLANMPFDILNNREMVLESI